MNLHDAANICRPLGIPERPLDPPDSQFMTDAEESEYLDYVARWQSDLEHEFAEAERDRFDEFCRDKFDAEFSDDGPDDFDYDRSKEDGAL